MLMSEFSLHALILAWLCSSDGRISKSLYSCGRSRGMCMQWRWFSNMQFAQVGLGLLGEPLPTYSGVLHCGRLKIADFDLGVLYNPEARDEPCVEHWISTISGEQTP
ncbi:hypothetical protein RHMOL_Rhmol05G0160300 [Rhododendron molle]|uniref:Uncharacterized protein n=2 Tax=Rhododendron molle TaxID=49168 RepID=A0ACC0NRS7_RHOML|nr:hypothetical protein RHMOL_Rhmol05G0160300 [Rhododendron molle]KAI8555253.1 hypothetical protein RHMOL_Rhmol05G0160300 [Rhododendron molle]